MMNEIEDLRKKTKHLNRTNSTKSRAIESLQSALMSCKNSGEISPGTSKKLDVSFLIVYLLSDNFMVLIKLYQISTLNSKYIIFFLIFKIKNSNKSSRIYLSIKCRNKLHSIDIFYFLFIKFPL